MRILLASSEVHPYSKTGGLADMVGALAKTLARAGHQVGMVTPLYAGIRERFPQLKRVDLPLEFPLGAQPVRGEIWSLEPIEGLTCILWTSRVSMSALICIKPKAPITRTMPSGSCSFPKPPRTWRCICPGSRR